MYYIIVNIEWRHFEAFGVWCVWVGVDVSGELRWRSVGNCSVSRGFCEKWAQSGDVELIVSSPVCTSAIGVLAALYICRQTAQIQNESN